MDIFELYNSRPLLARITFGKNPGRTAVRAVVLGMVCFLVFRYAVRPVIIDGVSMLPTISNHSIHFVNLLAYRKTPPTRGDIVIVEKDGFNTMYLKRVIGLPDETVRFQNGALFIDNQIMPEPYLRSKGDWDMRLVTLGESEYFVAGDNRSVERERHVMGTVDRNFIMGRLLK